MKTEKQVLEAIASFNQSNESLKQLIKDTKMLDDTVRFMLAREIIENKLVIEALEWVLKN